MADSMIETVHWLDDDEVALYLALEPSGIVAVKISTEHYLPFAECQREESQLSHRYEPLFPNSEVSYEQNYAGIHAHELSGRITLHDWEPTPREPWQAVTR